VTKAERGSSAKPRSGGRAADLRPHVLDVGVSDDKVRKPCVAAAPGPRAGGDYYARARWLRMGVATALGPQAVERWRHQGLRHLRLGRGDRGWGCGGTGALGIGGRGTTAEGSSCGSVGASGSSAVIFF
jgi:hypothetical protein